MAEPTARDAVAKEWPQPLLTGAKFAEQNGVVSSAVPLLHMGIRLNQDVVAAPTIWCLRN